ncbi:hypothetical protein J3R82DRAFT_6337 [Butyriboletus roseoflavus]|nr:hypothetical protein J3R82DRAFT_6337 [Butyriboletus roseoflavus]
MHLSTAPPRRASGRVTQAPPRRIRRVPSSPAPFVAHNVSASIRPSVSEQDRFNAPLYTFKAFAIATAIVMSSATASVAGIMAYLDVRNQSLLHACEHGYHNPCRCWQLKSIVFPTFHDSVDGDPVLLAAATPRHESSTPTAFNEDAAQQRLAEAFDKGGFDAWGEAAAREMEAETEVERSRRSKTT